MVHGPLRCACIAVAFCWSVRAGLGSAEAGAWTQQKGGYYVKVSGGYFHATEDIDASGAHIRKPGDGLFKDYDYSVYSEYGLAEGLTLVASVPYQRLHDRRTFVSGITRETRTGLGDAQIHLRKSIRTGKTVAAIQLGGKLPLWYEDDPGTRVPLSSQKLDYDVRLQVGRSLYPVPAYFTGEVGYRHRGGTLSDEIIYSLEGGLSAGKFLFKGVVSGVRTTGDRYTTFEVGLIGDQDILQVSPGVIYRAAPNVELSFEQISIVAGANTTAGSTWLLGVAFKR